MNERKLTNDELRDLLLENCQDEYGDLVICGIDLSKFKGNVILNNWKVNGSATLSHWDVKGNLTQSFQSAKNIDQRFQSAKNIDQSYQTAENLYQHCQKVNGDLEQSYQIAENLNQSYQNVSKDLVSQKLKEDEEWVDFQGDNRAVIRTKKLKEISKDELAEMGYKLKEK